MGIFSRLARVLGKKQNIGPFEKTEARAKALFTPSDWLIVGVFFLLMVYGAGVLIASASFQLSEEVPVYGGTHTEGVIGSPRFINPLLAVSETDNDLTALVFAGLMRSESNGSLSPHLAQSYEVSPDGLSYTFTLRDNINFHDGTPITAEDVVFTIQSAKNPEIKSPRRANWEGVEVIALDERTVSFTLREPFGLFLENATLGILPKHLWESIRPEEFPFSDLNTSPIGSGFYRVTSVKKSSSGVPTEYKLAASRTTEERPFIAQFIFRFYPNRDALVTALNTGEIDATHSITPEEIVRDTELREAVFARVFAVFFNQNQQELFADEVVRKALNESLDKQAIVDTILDGYGTPLSGPLPPQQVSERLPLSNPEERRATAQNILINDGWELGEDGILVKETDDETRRLQFALATANASELKAAAELVAEEWRAIGVDVSLQFFDQTDLNLEVIRPRRYDALLFGLVVGRELDLFAFWHSSQRNDPGLNIALYANITTDKFLTDARNTLDPTERLEHAENAASEIAGETAAVFLYAPHFVYAHEERLRGVALGAISKPSDRFAGIQNWYVHTERVWPFFNR